MPSHLFLFPGDLTDLRADAVAYSTSTRLDRSGHLHHAFGRMIPGFDKALAAARREAGDEPDIGKAYWQRLPAGPDGDVRPRGIVVVPAAGAIQTGDEDERDERARLAVRSAVTAAVAGLQRDFPDLKQWFIALPAFRHGRGGDRRRVLRSALVQIEEAVAALHKWPQLDLAFVPYTEDSYKVFVQARREVLGPPACPLENAEQVKLVEERLVPALREQRGVLFAGAGLSRGAGLDGWHGLINRLAAALKYKVPEAFDLDLSLQLAQWYAEEQGRDRLTAILQELYGGLDSATTRPAIRPTLAHYLLLALPLRLVVTTNYDCLLERALRGLRRDPQVIVEGGHVVRVGQPDHLGVVKFHGDAESGRNLTLTEADYDTFFEKHPVLTLLLEGLLLNHTFLFAGYRLRDPNFRMIYGRVSRMLAGADRHAFAIHVEAPNAYAERSWAAQRLHLLQMPGEDDNERVRQSGAFLDWLLDRVIVGDGPGLPAGDEPVASLPPGLFLLENVRVSGPLEKLRRALLEQVGQQVEDAYQRGRCGPDEARTLAQVLECLTKLGWRPASRGTELYELWEWLATAVDNAAEARRLLRVALRHTVNLDQAERIRAAIGKRAD